MASTSYSLILTVVTVSLLSTVIFVLAEEREGSLEKRRRLCNANELLCTTGRLRRIYKKEYDDPIGYEGHGMDIEAGFNPNEFLKFLDDFEALDRLQENSVGYSGRKGNEREEGGRKLNGWFTGMYGKRYPLVTIRESRNVPAQIIHGGDYFGKRFSDGTAAFAALDWKRAPNLQDVTDEDME